MKSIKINISASSIMLVLASLALVWMIYVSKDVILFLFASYIIASALFPSVDWLEKKMPRWLAVGILYVLGFIILSTILVPFFIILTKQAQEFIRQMPVYYKSIEGMISNLQSNTSLIGFLPDQEQIYSTITKYGENIVSQSINITVNIFGTIVAVFTLATIVLFILLDKESLKKGFLGFFPEDNRKKAEKIVSSITKRVGGYVRGQLMVMLAVGVVTGLVLSVLKIPFAFLLGLVAGILEIIPIIGPILSAVPAVLLALAINPWLALIVIGVYLVIQRIENMVSPYIYGKFLDMPPLVIISVLLISASTLGIKGVILSPALAAAGYVVVQELYLKKLKA